jgi:hypothetical protein
MAKETFSRSLDLPSLAMLPRAALGTTVFISLVIRKIVARQDGKLRARPTTRQARDVRSRIARKVLRFAQDFGRRLPASLTPPDASSLDRSDRNNRRDNEQRNDPPVSLPRRFRVEPVDQFFVR